MKTLCSGPVHKEPLTLPYCWVLRDCEPGSGQMPYIVHQKGFNEDGTTWYANGYYFNDLGKALAKWHEKVYKALMYNFPANFPRMVPMEDDGK